MRCETVNLAAGDFIGLPSDFDYVLNFAVAKSGQLGQRPRRQRGVGRPADGPLPQRKSVPALLVGVPSTTPRTTNPAPSAPHWATTTRPLFPTYSISKIAGEVVARTMARALGVPTVIARLNVPYGDNGGWPYYHMEMMLAGIPIPVPAGGPARYNPIHEDDIIATIPKLLEVASVPATTLNWCGDQAVSLQEWCGYLGSLVGKEPVFQESEQALRGNPTDPSRMRELVGGTTVDWQDGMRRLATKFHPELVGSG